MTDFIVDRVLHGVDVPIFHKDGSILMLRRSVKDESYQSGWEYVKGGLKAGESFVDAALREAQEEAGSLGFTLLQELPDEYWVDARYRNKSLYDYVTKRAVVLVASEREVTLDHHEHDKFEWMGLEKAIANIWVENGQQILARAGHAFKALS